MEPTYYGIGSANLFDFVRCQNEIEMLRAAHQAITNCELWDWLRNYQARSFMFDNSKEIKRINTEMHKDPVNNNHSGSSYGFTMRQMEYLAKNGYGEYRKSYIANSTQTAPIT